MEQYISKSALLAEIERLRKIQPTDEFQPKEQNKIDWLAGKEFAIITLQMFLDTLEVKEVDLEKERMSECPYRKVGCTMYEGTILECNGACSWVVDYPKLKELKAQKGE